MTNKFRKKPKTFIVKEDARRNDERKENPVPCCARMQSAKHLLTGRQTQYFQFV